MRGFDWKTVMLGFGILSLNAIGAATYVTVRGSQEKKTKLEIDVAELRERLAYTQMFMDEAMKKIDPQGFDAMKKRLKDEFDNSRSNRSGQRR